MWGPGSKPWADTSLVPSSWISQTSKLGRNKFLLCISPSVYGMYFCYSNLNGLRQAFTWPSSSCRLLAGGLSSFLGGLPWAAEWLHDHVDLASWRARDLRARRCCTVKGLCLKSCTITLLFCLLEGTQSGSHWKEEELAVTFWKQVSQRIYGHTFFFGSSNWTHRLFTTKLRPQSLIFYFESRSR